MAASNKKWLAVSLIALGGLTCDVSALAQAKVGSTSTPTPETAQQKNSNLATAQAINDSGASTEEVVNKMPGAKVDPSMLHSNTKITGFHPFKKMFQPIKDLEDNSVKLEQQVMKLQKPINSLNEPMVVLQKKMVHVDSQIGGVQRDLTGVATQVTGSRSDLGKIRKEINKLDKPLQAIVKPVESVAGPLVAVERLLNLIMVAIFVAVCTVAIGTPVSAILLYVNRERFFPGLQLHAHEDLASSQPVGAQH